MRTITHAEMLTLPRFTLFQCSGFRCLEPATVLYQKGLNIGDSFEVYKVVPNRFTKQPACVGVADSTRNMEYDVFERAEIETLLYAVSRAGGVSQ